MSVKWWVVMKLMWKFFLKMKNFSRRNSFVKNFLFIIVSWCQQLHRVMMLKKNFSRWDELSDHIVDASRASSLVDASCHSTRVCTVAQRGGGWGGGGVGDPPGDPPRDPPGDPPDHFRDFRVGETRADTRYTPWVRRARGLKWNNVHARNDYWCYAPSDVVRIGRDAEGTWWWVRGGSLSSREP